MKKYENMDNFRPRIHVLEITFQSGEFKGTIKQRIGGNCFGLDILNYFSIDDLCTEDLYENSCNLELLDEDEDGNNWFRFILKNDEGDECEIEDEVYELKNYIVKLEIVDCVIKK